MIKSPSVRQLSKLLRFLGVGLGCLVLLFLVGGSSSQAPQDQTERARSFTRDIEFDYVGWIASALRMKVFDTALGGSSYLNTEQRHASVLEYLDLVRHIYSEEYQLALVYSDPNIDDPESASADIRSALDAMYARRDLLQPLAESVLQDQISYMASQMGLAVGGQPLPPVLYHSTPLPLALIVSPRETIRQDADISLLPDVHIDRRVELEARVDQALNVSSLVVEVGGVGVYPTMVQETSSLDWLSEVVSHEWVHNFLTLRPLGMNYLSSPELRIMNETTAALAGKEMGRALLETFYPELLPPPPAPAPPASEQPAPPPEPPAFDFNAEMHQTRLWVDQLLAEGKIEQAEDYMELRRRVFWGNGYRHLRKLNQAYFAFHGAYADEPGGASGAREDPVGSAVRQLRAQSNSLADFLYRIAWLYTFEDLQQAVESGAAPSGAPGQ